MEHAKVSEFFPKPAEILGLIRTWHSVQAAEQDREKKAQEKLEERKRIAAGEATFGWGDVLTTVSKMLAAKDDLTPERKKELKERIDGLVAGKR